MHFLQPSDYHQKLEVKPFSYTLPMCLHGLHSTNYWLQACEAIYNSLLFLPVAVPLEVLTETLTGLSKLPAKVHWTHTVTKPSSSRAE